MRERLPLYAVALALGLASGLLSAWLCHPATRAGLLAQGLWRAELISYDYRLSYAPTKERSEEIVLVTIDDESLSQEGLQIWPWPREYHARVLKELKQAGARLIGLDVILAGVSGGKGSGISETGPLALPTPSRADRALTEAIELAGNVVLAMEIASSPVAGKEGAAELEVGGFPYEDFEDAALGLGSVNLPRDLDGVIRRAGVAVTFQEQSYPSMPIALAARYLRREPGAFSTEVLTEGRAEHPALGGRSVLLPYRAPVGAGFVRLPYYRVLQGDFDKAEVKGKIVLVGSTARSLQDLHYTPMAMRGVGGVGATAALMAGVEILANATDAVLHERTLIPLATIWTALLTVLTSMLMALALVRLRPSKALFLAWLPLVAISVVVSFELFWIRQLWVPLMPLLLGVTLSYGAGTVYLELTAQRAQRQLRQAWSRRVSPDVLAVILTTPGLTRIGGRRLVGTVLFSDLQDFTKFCHSTAPEKVVERINKYFSVASEVMRKHGGTILKFIGDGVMAVFGDPVPQPDHARRALEAAIEFVQRMQALAEQAGEDEWAMHVRVGLHTGELVAGDVGSEQLLEYTVMGDTVSTASRLEAINKQFGTQIVLSGDTAEHVGDGYELVPLGETDICGRDEPMLLYTVREVGNHEDRSNHEVEGAGMGTGGSGSGGIGSTPAG